MLLKSVDIIRHTIAKYYTHSTNTLQAHTLIYCTFKYFTYNGLLFPFLKHEALSPHSVFAHTYNMRASIA